MSVEEESRRVAAELKLDDVSEAFESLAFGLIFDVSYDDLRQDERIDNNQDKQIDIIRIVEDSDNNRAYIHIMQVKNKKSFESNVVIGMKNGIDWIFASDDDALSSLKNVKFRNKIAEINEVLAKYYPSNVYISVYYVTRGDKENLSDEYLQEKAKLLAFYKELRFGSFEFVEYGASELYNLLNNNQKNSREVSMELPIVYDENLRSLIEYQSDESKSLICTVRGSAIAEIVSQEPEDAIFDMNVRKFLGHRGRVNSDIKKSCVSDEASKFWFLNNGITMVCDSFELNIHGRQKKVKVENAQIVNGCQTSVTIREAWREGLLQDDVCILVKIVSTKDRALIDKITLSTNNQNKVTERDLRSNDQNQRDIQSYLKKKYNINYERKNREFKGNSQISKSTVVPNDKAAQAALAVILKRPSIARGYLAKVWSDFYGDIVRVEPDDLVYAYLIYKYVNSRSKTATKNDLYSDIEKENAIYGSFHIARAMGYKLRKDKWGSQYIAEVSIAVSRLLNGEMGEEDYFGSCYDSSLRDIGYIRLHSQDISDFPALFFKNNILDIRLDNYIKTGEISKKNLNNS